MERLAKINEQVVNMLLRLIKFHLPQKVENKK